MSLTDTKTEAVEEDMARDAREKTSHPARNLKVRHKGFGVAAGYEKPYRKDASKKTDRQNESYGHLPHAGYYGAGIGLRPFKTGQAGFREEIDWYGSQYGEMTSGYSKVNKRKE